MSHDHPSLSQTTQFSASSETNPSDTRSELLTYTRPTIFGHVPVLKRLRELRYRAGLKQIELADRAHLTRTTVIRLEQGNSKAEATTIRKLARALKVSIPELIGDD